MLHTRTLPARTGTTDTRQASNVSHAPRPLTELSAPLQLNVALRALMELGIVLAFAMWGYHAGAAPATRVLLAGLAPLLGFGLWGAVDFRWAGRLGEPLRLLQELLLTALAAAALAAAGHPGWGWGLAAASATHHALVYALGQRLLRH
jgi:hypothetical protein